MSNAIVAEHCFLLSEKRIEDFQGSGIQATEKNIKTYIRSVLRGLNLTDISDRSGVDISIVVALSNSFNTGKELLAFLTQYNFLSSIFRPEDKDLIINIILSEGISDLKGRYDSLAQEILTKLKQQKSDKNQVIAEKYLEGLAELFAYLGLANTHENRHFFFTQSEVGRLFVIGDIVDFAKEKEITSLRTIKEDGFLHWYAEKERLETHPDAILSMKLLISGVPEVAKK